MNTKGIYVNRILNLSVIFLLAFAVMFSFGVRAFADSNNDAGSSIDVPASELLDSKSYNPEILNLAKTLQASTATTYDLDDIYNIVNECANALVEYDGSEFVSVTEYVHACLTGIASGLFNGSSQNPYLGSINNNIASIQAAVYGPAWDGSGVINSLWNALQTLYSVNHADQLAQMAKQQGIIDALVGNTQYSLSYKLDNMLSSLDNIKWLNGSVDSISYHTSLSDATQNVNPITTSSNYNELYVRFKISNATPHNLIRLLFPVYYTTSSTSLFETSLYWGNTEQPNFNHYYTSYNYTGYLLFYSPNSYSFGNSSFILKLKGANIRVSPSTNAVLYYLNDSTQDYYTVADFINQANTYNKINHIDSDIHNQSDVLNRFKELYASDDLVAAKQAQQSVEDSAIADFSGNGSASMKGSDVTSAKNISNQVKEGLNAGGSVSNGLSAFSSSNAFWGWFSQDNANYFVVDVPSGSTPQPVLRSLRSEWSDDVPDVISSIDEEYYNQLGGE